MNSSFLTLLTIAAMFAVTKCHPFGGSSADDTAFQADDLDAFWREDLHNDTAQNPDDIRNETLFHDDEEAEGEDGTGGEGRQRRGSRVRRVISLDNACDGSGDGETDESFADEKGQTVESVDMSSINRTVNDLRNTFEQFLSTLVQTSSHYQMYCRSFLSNGSQYQDTRRSQSTGSQIQGDLDPMCTVNSILKRAASLVDSVRNWELAYSSRVARTSPAVLASFSALMSGPDRSLLYALCQVQTYISTRRINCTAAATSGADDGGSSRGPIGRIARFRSNCRLLKSASTLINSCTEITRNHGSTAGAI